LQIVDKRTLPNEELRYMANLINVKVFGSRNIPAQNGTVSSSLKIVLLKN
jgi:hypothetical protein